MTTRTDFRWTFAIMSLAWFAFALDRLLVTTALPVIRVDVDASPADLEWTVNAYTLTFAVLLLTGAALGDRFGRRRIFTVGMTVFTAGSATTIRELAVVFGVAGIGLVFVRHGGYGSPTQFLAGFRPALLVAAALAAVGALVATVLPGRGSRGRAAVAAEGTSPRAVEEPALASR